MSLPKAVPLARGCSQDDALNDRNVGSLAGTIRLHDDDILWDVIADDPTYAFFTKQLPWYSLFCHNSHTIGPRQNPWCSTGKIY